MLSLEQFSMSFANQLHGELAGSSSGGYFSMLLLPVCSGAQLCVTLGNPIDCSPPGSSVMRFPRQEYWNGLPSPSPGDLPDPGIEPKSPALAGGFFTTEPPEKAQAQL